MAGKLPSPIVRHGREGRSEAPRNVLVDEFGVPMPNADQRRTDLHGRELQPETDPDMPYTPAGEVAEAVGARTGEAAERYAQRRLLSIVRKTRLRQVDVDPVRLRVLCHLYRSSCTSREFAGHVRHLWFPVAGDIDNYALRDGNPPADSSRPRHLRGLNLVIDINQLPDRITAMLRPDGVLDILVRDRARLHGLEGRVGMAALLGTAIDQLAPRFAEEMRLHLARPDSADA